MMQYLRTGGLALVGLVMAACSTLPAPTPTSSLGPAPSANAPLPDTPPSNVQPTATAALPVPSADPGERAGGSSLPMAELPAVPPVAEVVAPRDLWERIARGFAMPDLQDERVQRWENWYANRPDYLQRMTDRGRKYLFYVVEELERRNLPLELALLPFVESAFNPQAVSRAKAAGMWQFMPATGKHFDLKQNAFRDDRRDVLASTRAALDYLERLYQLFGDWHLALAAYNWGEGNVQRAMRRQQAAGLGTAYTELRMPDETRNYVPKLQALKNLVRNPDAFGVHLPVIGNHPFFDTVRIERDIDVALVARLAGISEADFRALNPSYHKPVIMAAGTPDILLPWDNALQFAKRLQQHRGPTASWTAWRVPSDMSVAQAARQLGWDEQALRRLNDIPPRMKLKAGATILVPREGRLDRDVPEHIADNGQILLAPEPPPVKTVKVRVRAGETLASVARRYRVPVADLAAWNQLRVTDKLRPGQILRIQVASKARGAQPPTRSAKATPKPRAPATKLAQRR